MLRGVGRQRRTRGRLGPMLDPLLDGVGRHGDVSGVAPLGGIHAILRLPAWAISARWVIHCSMASADMFLPDGHTVLISSVDGAISTWDTSAERAIEFACQVAGRNLTKDEWRDAFGSRPYRETCPVAV